MKTNNSIFTRVLALVLCMIMVVGLMTSCFQSQHSHEDGVNEGQKDDFITVIQPGTVTKPSVEDAKDPNEVYSASTEISNDALIYGALSSDVVIGGEEGVTALIPADVKVELGASSLALSIKNVEEEAALDGEVLTDLDVHISGVALDNKTPITVKLGAILPIGLKNTELKFYHLENGVPVLMMRVNSVADFAIHNQYVYNEETGDVTIHVSSFSVFSARQTNVSKWENDTVANTSWYNENDTQFTLNDVADFLGFRDLVDGGNKFEGKTVTLATDIDLDNKLFNPIGGGWAYNGGKTFNGTFDGGNHTIYNLRVNGWELDATDKHSGTSMGAGLFSSIHNATIQNIAVVGSELIVETTSIGIIAGCAQGKCTFENIIVSDATIGNYQMRNGGIVGDIYVIESDNVPENEYSHTFTNIVVDSTVKLSSMWGDFDTGNGGVIGGKYGSAKVLMQNVIVAAEIDAFSDVTAAYQWYAYRRCGMLVGYTGQNSPKQATNAAADFLTCVNVNVYYGDWVNYTYYQFANQDSSWQSNYPWVRAQESDYNGPFSNVRYGNPVINGVKINTIELAEANKTGFAAITFNQLYGGGQGVYGTAEHKTGGIITHSKTSKTIYIHNNLDWTNLKLQYWFANGDDTWTTTIDGIDMSTMLLENGIYKLNLPIYVDGFKIVADGDKEIEFDLSELAENNTYTVGGEEHVHEWDAEGNCDCGAKSTTKWELVTDASNIKVGDSIIIVATNSNVALSTTQNKNNRGQASVKKSENVITFGADVQIITLEAGNVDGTFAFNVGDGYLYAASSSDNYLRTETTLSNNSSWTITIEDGVATITAKGSNTRNLLRYNSTNSLFSCYASGQQDINIYVQRIQEICAVCTMEEINRQNPTCLEDGYVNEQCTECGNIVTTNLDAYRHNYSGTNPYICMNNCGVHNLPEAGSTITIQEALWIAETLENGKETSNKYVITGVIDDKDHPSNTGATTITVGEHSIYITNIHNIDGSVGYKDFITKIKNGDEITVSAKIAKNDSSEAQLRETWLAAHLDTNEDGTCDYCGTTIGGTVEPDPEAPVETTVSMNIFADQGSLENKVITWTSGDIKVSNAQGSSTSAILTTDTNLFRVYANSTFTISAPNISKIVITCTSSSYATACKNTFSSVNGCTATISGSVVTITFETPVDTVTAKATAQFRLNNIEVTYTTGDNGGSEGGETPTPEHTCTSICDNCGKCTDTLCTESVCVNNQCPGHESVTEPSVVLEITPSDFNGTSYAANNNTKAENGYSYTSNQVMLQSNIMQWQKSNGYITISSNEFVKLELKSTAGTFTVTVGGKTVTGTTTNGVTTYDLTGLTGQIKISVGSVLGKTEYIKFYK